MPEHIDVVFNHNTRSRYRSPLTGDWRNGDDKEAWLIEAIDGATKEVLVAIQELSLPRIAQALITAQQRGIRVAVVMENNYRQAWSEQRPSRLNPRERQRWHQLNRMADSDRDGTTTANEAVLGDAIALLQAANIPLIDDTEDGSSCSGVLHHMQNPGQGLAGLNSKLKPGGYFKIGLYIKLARQNVSRARELIQNLGIQSTPEGIRDFRKQVFDDKKYGLKDLSELASDFYFLSECRDLCFHVQKHQFNTETLEKHLKAEHLVFCGFMLPKSIHFSEHVSILGLQTFVGRFPKANEEQSNQQQKPLLPSTNGNETFFLPETSRPFGGFDHQDIVLYFAD